MSKIMKYELRAAGGKWITHSFSEFYKQCMSQKYKQKEVSLLCLLDIKL